MTAGMLDDGVALRFHLMRGMAEFPYPSPDPSPLSFLWRSRSRSLTLVVLDLLALCLALQGSWLSLVLATVPKMLAWAYDRHERRLQVERERPVIWRHAAYLVARHIRRDPSRNPALRDHGNDVYHTLLKHTRASQRSLRPADVLAALTIAAATTLRNRILVLSYLQLLLLADAERLRQVAIQGADELADDEREHLLAYLRTMPGRGRRPVSLERNGAHALADNARPQQS